MSTEGRYIARAVDNVELDQGKSWDYFYGLFDEKFNLVAEFLRLPQEALGKKGIDSIAQAFADDLGSRAFTPSACCVLGRDDLIYFGYPLDYEIKVYSPTDGKLVKIIQRDHEPMKIGVRHKEHFRRNQSEQFMAKMPPGLEDEIFDLVEYPKYKPAYERFTLMENGWLFVVVDSMGDAAKSVDIFNERGEYQARFETDVPTERLFFNNGKAYSIAYVHDYPYIKRYGFQILGYDDDPS